MNEQPEKNKNVSLLEDLSRLITSVSEKIAVELLRVKKEFKILSERRSPTLVEQDLMWQMGKRENELEVIHRAPFFTKIVLLFPEDNKNKTLYFSKYQFSSEGIYSWVAPAASVRFEQPGDVSYVLPDGKIVKAKLLDKEQYMIVGGKVIFFSKETIDSPRKLIHHDYFSSRKGTFELPEIIAVMEKAQDAVIRAHYKGAFVISGPAGSGKTTLALHRIAFLLQSPDTTELYAEKSVIVFVQDTKTKDYFSHLLPNLGINDVKIVTFFEWAFDILQLTGVKYCTDFGNSEKESGLYEFEKIKILRKLDSEKYNSNIFSLLENIYRKKLPEQYLFLFSEQKKKKVLDRIDITIALSVFYKTYKKFETIRTFNVCNKNGEIQKKKEKTDIRYSLVLIDEFQNYLPEQLTLLNSCLKQETKSMIYVGDINQQVRLGTIRSFNQIDENLDGDRNIMLHKVYRNTKQILEYIGSLGYKVEVPTNIKEGPEVVEKIILNQENILQYVQNLILANPEKSFGILNKNSDLVDSLKSVLKHNNRVHISTILESQGIEFDVVCVIGDWKNFFFTDDQTSSTEYIAEKKRVDRDLLYVALTRASEEIHVLGNSSLRDYIQHLNN